MIARYLIKIIGPGFLSAFLFGCSIDYSIADQTATFMDELPQATRSSVLWYCDYEDESFVKWEDAGTDDYYAGGGIFVTDDENTDYGISDSIFYSGRHGCYATITNAVEPGEKKAVRFMRWTDKSWDRDGDYFPDEAYYSVFIYFPAVYDPAKDPRNDPNNDGGWWNVFQFKSDNYAGSQPVVVLDIYNENGAMYAGLVIKDYPDDNSESHTQEYVLQTDPISLPSNEWHHLEMLYGKSKQYEGTIKVWQNGILIFEEENIRTVLPPGETATWGIGNYTDYIDGGIEKGTATVYFDDAIVSTVRVSGNIP